MIWLIGLGGSLGAGSRFLLSVYINNRATSVRPFPLSTWIINITGSLLLGVIAQLHLLDVINEWVWYFGGIGFCGAFTTFSTFGYESINLLLSRNYKNAVIYITTSVTLGIVFAAIGLLI